MKKLGGRVTQALTEKYAQSTNWKEGKFQNLEPTSMHITIQKLPKILYKQFCKTEGRIPAKPIEIVKFDKDKFLEPSGVAKFIWYGHSVVLLRINNKTLLIDPMLGPNASPINNSSTARFSENTLELIQQLPQIDLVLFTHDHYDHLDFDSMQLLKEKTKQYYTAMGVGRHLSSWGVAASAITEFDWWQESNFEDIQLTFTPSRHFSGRGLRDRSKSLWGGWVFTTANENIFFSGDGGYGTHFKTIGQRKGPFNFGFMECGQYNENWHQIHMFPAESIQAALDARVEKVMPVHWAGFALAQHHWKEPAEKFTDAAAENNLPCMFPKPGQIFSAGDNTTVNWWQQLE